MLLRCASTVETVRFSWQKWSVSWPLTVEIEIISSPDNNKIFKYTCSLGYLAILTATLMLLAVWFLAK